MRVVLHRLEHASSNRASTPVTQLHFVRLSRLPALVKGGRIEQCRMAHPLEGLKSATDHVFTQTAANGDGTSRFCLTFVELFGRLGEFCGRYPPEPTQYVPPEIPANENDSPLGPLQKIFFLIERCRICLVFELRPSSNRY
jgi:hypothetical protein